MSRTLPMFPAPPTCSLGRLHAPLHSLRLRSKSLPVLVSSRDFVPSSRRYIADIFSLAAEPKSAQPQSANDGRRHILRNVQEACRAGPDGIEMQAAA
ncbi:hypothetical protein BV25DRAFT_1823235 [Artomyces pyxidatus]|uniref:Uncharacterized protein n=2 Tax=Artomyces pyxidatus TaxID=48021 RepID=A0ACB8T7Z2_9AGAM|nr:hypothetical protein BV25DRAFT_1825435 [Artomyces pyxidatus]KAI0064268.1 hypothetical protein BV25DRAFT_1823235 [Artomyces pyxidatus]